MQVKIEKQPKSQIKINVILPSTKVKETYEKILSEKVESTEVQGFRKGNAPKEMVVEKLGVSKLYGETINRLLQTYYPQAIKEKHVAPISNPRVEIKEFDLEKDFEFDALVATKPEVKIGEYKSKLKKKYEEKVKSAKKELQKVNEEKLAKGEKLEEPHVHMNPNEVIDTLAASAEVEIPELLIDEEVERMMARLVDQMQTLGMSVDQYLKAQNKTSEEIRADYAKIAEKNLRAEFVMAHLITEEKINVTDQEIEATIKAAGIENAEERAKDPRENLYIKSILQKNKLIGDLIAELEGEKHAH